MKKLLLILPVLVAGCASTNDVRALSVSGSFDSQKNVAEISNCLVANMAQLRGAKVKTHPINDGIAVSYLSPVGMWSMVSSVTEVIDRGDSRIVTLKAFGGYNADELSAWRKWHAACF